MNSSFPTFLNRIRAIVCKMLNPLDIVARKPSPTVPIALHILNPPAN